MKQVVTAYRPDRYESEQLIQMLVETYPQCFFEVPRQRRPLKKNILNDLINDGFPVARKPLGCAIDWYQSHYGYHYALQAGAERIDLNGKAAGKVTQHEATAAQKYIAARQSEMNERTRNPIDTMNGLHRAGKVSDDALRKLPAPEVAPKPAKIPASDPIARLQGHVDAMRRAMTDTPNEALRVAFAVAGLGVVIKEAQKMIAEYSGETLK
jgi:ProP effector